MCCQLDIKLPSGGGGINARRLYTTEIATEQQDGRKQNVPKDKPEKKKSAIAVPDTHDRMPKVGIVMQIRGRVETG